MSRTALSAFAVLAVACSATAPEPARPVPRPDPPPPPAIGLAPALPPTGTSAAPPAPAPPPEPTAPEVAFPPAPITAFAHDRTRQEGDGQWAPYPEGTSASEALMYKAVVHPHPLKREVFAIVVAIDRTAVDLHLVAGIHEPESKTVDRSRRHGLVAPEHHAGLVAVFNGGFMQKHGNFGMRVGDDRFVPPREGLCTVAGYDDGELRIRTWEHLQADEPRMRFVRQTPPCLLEAGELHPALPAADTTRSKWGGAADGKQEVRRSALGLDATGQLLFYAYGDWISSRRLAEVIQAAGAHHAAQLDINWSYTRFYPIDHASTPPRLGNTFVEALKTSPTMYIERGASKDFFYLTRRARPGVR